MSNLSHAATAREVATLREFTHSTADALAADHAKRGNEWPVSGDHLDTINIREEYYVPGYGTEQGDIIGRERRPLVHVDLWAGVSRDVTVDFPA